MSYKILKKRQLTPEVFLLEIEAPLIPLNYQPGQFVILRVDEEGERIPLTVFSADKSKGSICIVFQVAGKTTKALSLMNEGAEIADLAGPLGRPSEIPEGKNIILIGGGVGIAEIVPLAVRAKQANNITIIAGFRNRNMVILENTMKEITKSVFISTDDGSYGYKGFNTDILKQQLVKNKIDVIYSCGPVPMMEKISQIARRAKVKCFVSLNAIMLDGTGMCGSCRVMVGGKVKLCCIDGPDFDAEQVDFEDLKNRQRRFLEQEKISLREFNKRMGL